jgi:hypothetical protein
MVWRKLSAAMQIRHCSNPLDAGSAGGVATPHLEVEAILHRCALTRPNLSLGLARRCRSQIPGSFSNRKEQQFQGFQTRSLLPFAVGKQVHLLD